MNGESGFIFGGGMVGASGTKTAQLATVSVGTVTKVTATFRCMGKSLVSRI